MHTASPSHFSSAKSRIEALAYTFRNLDSAEMDRAAANLANNAPAFWHKASTDSAVACLFIGYLNKTQDVARAWDAYEADFRDDRRARSVRILDLLLPLNEAAARSLGDAYEEIATFCTVKELMDRTARAEDRALVELSKIGLGGFWGPMDYPRVAAAQGAVNRQAMTPAEVVGAVNLRDVVELV